METRMVLYAKDYRNIMQLKIKTVEYPFYILIFWLFSWGIIFLYGTFITIASITPDGKYVEKTNCVKKEKSECVKYSEPYYVTVGAEIYYSFISVGVITGAVSIIGGTALMFVNRKRG